VRVLALSLLSILPWSVHAADPTAYAYVSALQPPVWVEQNGQRTALTASDALLPGQHYLTGPNGRLEIAMADGSTVKFGENAAFEMPSLQLEQAGQESILKGALKISKGAFRYTAQPSGFIQKRQLDLYVGNDITIGLGNPDVWGKTEDGETQVCLLRGKIRVRSALQPDVPMEQVGSLYTFSKGQPPQTTTLAATEQLKDWTAQTAIDTSRPTLQSNGPYSVLIAVYLDEQHAEGIVASINKKGYPATLRTEKRGDVSVFNVLIEGLSNAQSAATYGQMLARPLYLKNPRVLGPA